MPQASTRYKTAIKAASDPAEVLVALGANQPSGENGPEVTLMASLKSISDSGLKIGKRSRCFATPCYPSGSGPDYVNAALSLRTTLAAENVIQLLHEIEAHFGRERHQRWGQRVLDLDLIAYGAQVAPDPQTHRAWREMPLEDQMSRTPDRLILPHPRMQDRAFVLVPLMEVAPDWVHPTLGQTVRQMHDALPQADRDAVRALDL